MAKIRWGVISTAKIGRDFVIPGLLKSPEATLTAIASRSLDAARALAGEVGADKAYGSYAELLADPEIDAVYNPLPNHLHVPMTLQAAAAGKHVLCEKPLGLNAAQAAELIAARDAGGVKIQEAFMVRSHPQWRRAREIVAAGRIGRVRSVNIVFSYFNRDPANVRNMAEIGGGALYDIGCYGIIAARDLFAAEPSRAMALIDRDPDFGTDRLTSFILDFAGGHGVVTVSTQMVPYQRVQALGETGRLEVRIPFNAPTDGETLLLLDDGSGKGDASAEPVTIAPVDQYEREISDFCRAIRGEAPQVMALEDSVANMAVIDAVFRSAATGGWAAIG